MPSTQKKHADGVVTVVLTADNHLGYTAFGQQPRKREELQQRLQSAFQQATDFAIGQDVDLFVQAGDLFDMTNPDERERSFVAARLAQLRQAGIRTFAVGGVHDTHSDTHLGNVVPAPQISYASLGALHYFAPHQVQMEPVLVDINGVLVSICGLSVIAHQEGDPLAHAYAQSSIDHTAISLLILHAPIEGLTTASSVLDTRAQVSRTTIADQTTFRYILAGYHHEYRHMHIGQSDLIVAGATQHVDFHHLDAHPGFVFLGLAVDGIRWCEHIPVDTLHRERLIVQTTELWPNESNTAKKTPTERILTQLHPLCNEHTIVQFQLKGELTRTQYHQLDLNQIRRYGEEHCFALAIDDSAVTFLSEQETTPAEIEGRFSLREELLTLADERVAAASNEQDKRYPQVTVEEILVIMDEAKK